MFVLGASAQVHTGGSSSGSSSHPSGGSSAPARSSGGGSVSRPSVGNGGVRPSFVGARVGAVNNGNAPQRTQAYGNRQGNVVRANYGYAPKPAVVAARGNFGYAQRTNVVPVGASNYRVVPGTGHNRVGFWSDHNYNYHNHGYYKSYYYPRIGFTCGVLSYGYYPFFWADKQYYYSDGLFYEYENEQYTVVEPPVGAEVTALPSDAQSIVINGQQYYESQGVYYQPYTKDDGTQVYIVAGKDGELTTSTAVQDDTPAAPKIGDVVNQLPSDCRKININGQKLYVSPDGVYYQQQVDATGVINFKIVGLPSTSSDAR
jgi:hypothetical protein